MNIVKLMPKKSEWTEVSDEALIDPQVFEKEIFGLDVDWSNFRYNEVSDEFAMYFIDIFVEHDMGKYRISHVEDLPIEIIRKHKSLLDWRILTTKIKEITVEFLKEFGDLMNIDELIKRKDLTKEVIRCIFRHCWLYDTTVFNECSGYSDRGRELIGNLLKEAFDDVDSLVEYLVHGPKYTGFRQTEIK